MSYLPTVIAVEGSDTALASTLSTLSTTLLYSLLSLLYSTPALQGRSTCVWLAGASLLSTRYSLRGSGQRAVRSGAVGPFFAQLAVFRPESWCRGRCRAAVVRVESGQGNAEQIQSVGTDGRKMTTFCTYQGYARLMSCEWNLIRLRIKWVESENHGIWRVESRFESH